MQNINDQTTLRMFINKAFLFLRIYSMPFIVLLVGFGVYYVVFEISYGIKEKLSDEYTISHESTTLTEREPLQAIPQDSVSPAEIQDLPKEIITTTDTPPVTQEVEGISQDTLVESPQQSPSYKVVVNSLKIRKNPESNALVVGGLIRGQNVVVLETKEGWARVEGGWVAFRFLEPSPDPAHTEGIHTSTLNSQPSFLYEVIFDSVNVRQSPSVHSAVVSKKTKGQQINVFEEREGWMRIDEGWIYKDLLRKKGE